MADKKFHTGDSVWFKYDNGRKEQKGIIQMVSDCHLYYILGKVTHECYSVREEDISSIAPHLRQTKYQVDTWVYFKGPDKQYFQGLIKDYDYGDHLYKIEYLRDGHTRNGYVFEREILDFKFKSGDEIQFRSDVAAWRRGMIISSYADKNGQIFYDINPWDEMIKAYTSLRGYKEIPEMNVRTYTDYNKLLWECKDSIPVQFSTDGVYLKENLPSFKLGIDTDSIIVDMKRRLNNMNNRPRDHKFVRTDSKNRRIKEVMFNGPATIIKWEPTMDDICEGRNKGDKTVSVCGVTDPYDKEKGFLLAVLKEFVDNQSYDNILRMMDSFNEERK